MSVEYLPEQPEWSELGSHGLADHAPFIEAYNALVVRYNFGYEFVPGIPIYPLPPIASLASAGDSHLEDGSFPDSFSVFTYLSREGTAVAVPFGYCLRRAAEVVRSGGDWHPDIPMMPTLPPISENDPESWYAYMIAVRTFIDAMDRRVVTP